MATHCALSIEIQTPFTHCIRINYTTSFFTKTNVVKPLIRLYSLYFCDCQRTLFLRIYHFTNICKNNVPANEMCFTRVFIPYRHHPGRHPCSSTNHRTVKLSAFPVKIKHICIMKVLKDVSLINYSTGRTDRLINKKYCFSLQVAQEQCRTTIIMLFSIMYMHLPINSVTICESACEYCYAW